MMKRRILAGLVLTSGVIVLASIPGHKINVLEIAGGIGFVAMFLLEMTLRP